jgi:hypothetical protein
MPLNLSDLEQHGLGYVAELVRGGRYVPDSVLVPAGEGRYQEALMAYHDWCLTDACREFANDVLDNVAEYGGWKDPTDRAEVREYLDSAWADHENWREMSEDERRSAARITARMVRDRLAN